jgi:hypothetical protein
MRDNGDPSSVQATRPAGTNGVDTPIPLARTPTDAYANQFGSYHTGICQFVLGDGSVRMISVAIDSDNLGRLAARNDGQVITFDY